VNNLGRKPIKPIKKQLMFFVIENNIKCAYCHRKYDEINTRRTLDHIVPKSKGGETAVNNVLVCCDTCNAKKGNDDIEVFVKNNKRIRENIRRYLEQVEPLTINNKSYHNALEWLNSIIKK